MLFVWDYLALHDWFFCATFSHLAPPKWELHLFMIPTLVPSSLACLLHLGGLPPDVLAFLVPLFLLPLTPFHIFPLGSAAPLLEVSLGRLLARPLTPSLIITQVLF